MSRIGSKPIDIPSGVDVSVNDGTVSVSKGEHKLTFTPHEAMTVEVDSDAKQIKVVRPDDSRQNRALHGLTRSLINNMVIGVQTPFEKRLEVHGVGYNASLNGNKLALQVGFANTIEKVVPSNIYCEVPKGGTSILVRSADKQACGQFAAEVRNVRPPEPYKGKGIRYAGEQIRRKAGKAEGKK